MTLVGYIHATLLVIPSIHVKSMCIDDISSTVFYMNQCKVWTNKYKRRINATMTILSRTNANDMGCTRTPNANVSSNESCPFLQYSTCFLDDYYYILNVMICRLPHACSWNILRWCPEVNLYLTPEIVFKQITCSILTEYINHQLFTLLKHDFTAITLKYNLETYFADKRYCFCTPMYRYLWALTAWQLLHYKVSARKRENACTL